MRERDRCVVRGIAILLSGIAFAALGAAGFADQPQPGEAVSDIAAGKAPSPWCARANDTAAVRLRAEIAPYTAEMGPSARSQGRGVPCDPVTLTYSDQPFDGTFNGTIQSGWVETEIAATSYTVPAGEFPLLFNLGEIIWAQTHFNPTVTQWSFLVWEGTPNTGTLIATFSSDDVILPHIQLPVGGAQAVNVQLSVDPGDPDQIIIQDNGTQTFSIGFRIDAHNNPPTASCLCLAGLGTLPAVCCPPDTLSNAWPAMDAAGPDFGSQNWVWGRDCPGGTALCFTPGWSQFSTLPAQFVNDWAIRVTYTPLNCPGASGACCDSTATCTDFVLQQNCQGAGETFFPNQICNDVTCPAPTGACCDGAGACLDGVDQNVCETQLLGIYGGDGSVCASGICAPGACCLADGSCQDIVEPACISLGGTFNAGTNCGAFTCPQPTGACCIGAVCVGGQTEAACVGFGGAWAGANTTCPANPADLCPICDDGDANQDGDVDLDDFAVFQDCFNGTSAGMCKCVDMDNDSDVDLTDFGPFQAALQAGGPV